MSTFWIWWGNLTSNNNLPVLHSGGRGISDAGIPGNRPLLVGVTDPDSEGFLPASLNFPGETGLHPLVPGLGALTPGPGSAVRCGCMWLQEPRGPSRWCRAWSCRAGCSGHGQGHAGLSRVEGVAMLGQEPIWRNRAKWQSSWVCGPWKATCCGSHGAGHGVTGPGCERGWPLCGRRLGGTGSCVLGVSLAPGGPGTYSASTDGERRRCLASGRGPSPCSVMPGDPRF